MFTGSTIDCKAAPYSTLFLRALYIFLKLLKNIITMLLCVPQLSMFFIGKWLSFPIFIFKLNWNLFITRMAFLFTGFVWSLCFNKGQRTRKKLFLPPVLGNGYSVFVNPFERDVVQVKPVAHFESRD
jgi:hypothetical protein